MSEKHTEFTGSIPETYDKHLGPLFFEYYAADLARRIDVPARGRVLETACAQLSEWKRLDNLDLRVSVNVSIRQFDSGDLLRTVTDALRTSGLDPHAL
ncbi:MAG: hypothetical protein IH805_03070, partial [Proteobacteria bacterium]|nr:hypothetical protein [Pseudomonadota bacterium]